MQDPLKPPDGFLLYEKVGQLISGAPLNVTRDIGVSILLNSIRQGIAKRSDAEAAFNEIFNRAKTLLLDVHYDSVTGNRKAVFPYTHVITPPLHVERSDRIDPCGR